LTIHDQTVKNSDTSTARFFSCTYELVKYEEQKSL